MGFSETLYASEKDTWQTPRALFDHLDSVYQFHLDAAAARDSARCPLWIGPDHPDPGRRDAFTLPWAVAARDALAPGERPRVFLNPPYGLQVTGPWLALAVRQARAGCFVCVLTLSRTDTNWWHSAVDHHAGALHFVEGRVRFEDPGTGMALHACPAPSVVIVLDGEAHRFARATPLLLDW